MKLLKNFSIYILGNVAVGAISFLLIPVYSKLLLPADYGLLNLIMYFIGIVSTLGDLGQGTAFCVLYYKKEEKSELILNSLAISVFAFSLICIPMIIWPGLLGNILKIKIDYSIQIKTMIIAVISIFSNFLLNLLRLLEKPISYSIASILKTLTLAILNILFLVILKQKYDSYINAALFSAIPIVIWGIVFIIRNYSFKGIRLRKATLFHLLKIGLPLLPYFILSIAFQASDKYVLNGFLAAAAVGTYSFGYKFGSLMESFISGPLGTAISPMLYKTYPVNQDKYEELLKNVWLIYLSIGLCTVLAFTTLGDVFFHFIVGENYWPSFLIAILALGGNLLNGAGIMLGANIIVKEKTYYNLISITGTIIVNIGLNIYLIPKIGIYGAIVSYVGSGLTALVINYVISQRLHPIKHKWSEIIPVTILICTTVIINYNLSNIVNLNPFRVGLKFVIAIIALGGVVYIIRKTIKFILSVRGPNA
jgi:O-antigen/teichoic acid export membrane protein